MFEKSLNDLIKGIRAHKKNEKEYILKCIEEIRKELKTDDMDYKAAAISKLAYLQMFGYDYGWASFHVVEVISSPNLTYKRIGYLAGTQSFRQDTEVLMLATNQLKKDLTSPRYFEVGIAINGLSQFLTPDLAQFLCQDLLNLLSHSRSYVRKRASLALYKVFLKFPEGLRVCFPKLKEKLEDQDQSVVTSAVNVICELSRKSPQSYLPLVPTLYRLLTTSNNNWMLIKIVKLFASLTPHEPRLVKKLLQPLRSIIETTPAMSLLYECIYTVITGGFLNDTQNEASQELAKMCSNKLRCFLEDQDQNLKYIGILALEKFQPLYPELVLEHGGLVLSCVDDFDYSIRIRSIDLLAKMVTKNSLINTVKKLIGLLIGDEANEIGSPGGKVVISNTQQGTWQYNSDPIYRRIVVEAIIEMCSKQTYINITNFEWYIATLLDLVYVSKVAVGSILAEQLLDVSVRVKSVRPYSVKMMTRLISDQSLYNNAHLPETNSEVLKSASLIIGEYSKHLLSPGILIKSIFDNRLSNLSYEVQAVYIQSSAKIFISHAMGLQNENGFESSKDSIVEGVSEMLNGIKPFTLSPDLEVQERACNISQLLNLINEHLNLSPPKFNILKDMEVLFQIYELNAVAAKAQSKVPLPEGLDLDPWLFEPPPKASLPSLPGSNVDFNSRKAIFSPIPDDDDLFNELSGEKSKLIDSKKDKNINNSKQRKQRKQRMKNDPFYIDAKSDDENNDSLLPDVDSIPIVNLEINQDSTGWTSKSLLESIKIGKNIKKGSKIKNNGINRIAQEVEPAIIDKEEMPEGVNVSDEESKNGVKDSSEVALASIDLVTPLKKNEKLPQIEAYKSPNQLRAQQHELLKAEGKKEKTKKKKKKAKEPKKEDNQTSLIDLDPLTSNLNKEKVKKTKKKSKSTKKKDDFIDESSSMPVTPLADILFEFPRINEEKVGVENEELRLVYELEGSGPSALEDAGTLIHFRLVNLSEEMIINDSELVFNEPPLKVYGIDLWNTAKLATSTQPGRQSSLSIRISPTSITNFNEMVELSVSLGYFTGVSSLLSIL
ncbi:Adaptor protein complex AP-3 delta subunit [Neoconidiobolus thromboides FSU 785]|nr:Adaptor protein complex AP-3 delta subunit [Neoconidiobolus thromboides FSU 785]